MIVILTFGTRVNLHNTLWCQIICEFKINHPFWIIALFRNEISANFLWVCVMGVHVWGSNKLLQTLSIIFSSVEECYQWWSFIEVSKDILALFYWKRHQREYIHGAQPSNDKRHIHDDLTINIKDIFELFNLCRKNQLGDMSFAFLPFPNIYIYIYIYIYKQL